MRRAPWIAAAVAVAVAVSLTGACEERHEPAIRVARVKAGGSGSANGSGDVDLSGGSGAAPIYRTAASNFHVDPALASTGKSAMVVSEDMPATEIGRQVLLGGGNAVDAAVATAFALAVSHPSAGNLTGGGFAIIRVDDKTEVALDFRETAPAAATADMYIKDGKPTKDSVLGDRASGVPGSVAGLFAMHQRYGKLPWKQLIAPAIALAQTGYTVDERMHAGLARVESKLAAFPASAALYLDHGHALAVGATVKNPDLAIVLQRIAEHGPDGFYSGETADAIVAEMTAGHGLITAADLKGYKAEWRDPLKFEYRGYHLASMPPPSSGGIVLAMTAGMLEPVDVGKLGWHSAAHIHWMVEVWRRAYAARNELLGDPAFVKTMPLARLLSPAYAAKLAATILPDRATPSKEVSGLVEGDHTTNLVTIDSHGMAVAMTTTLNTSYGNLVVVPHTGMLLNDEMDDFSVKPGSPNTFGLVQGTANKIEPGKRMLSSMSPTIIEDASGAPFMVVGAQGGPRIITDVWQTISNVIDFHMSIEAAIDAPRVHHQHLPDDVRVEDDAIDRPTAEALGAMGYKLVWGNDAHRFGAVTAIVRTPDGWRGAADSHSGGGAAGN